MKEADHYMYDMSAWTQPEQCVTYCALLLLSPAQKAITVPDKNKHLFSQAAITHFWVSVQEEGVPATGRPERSLD